MRKWRTEWATLLLQLFSILAPLSRINSAPKTSPSCPISAAGFANSFAIIFRQTIMIMMYCQSTCSRRFPSSRWMTWTRVCRKWPISYVQMSMALLLKWLSMGMLSWSGISFVVSINILQLLSSTQIGARQFLWCFPRIMFWSKCQIGDQLRSFRCCINCLRAWCTTRFR